jgi:hypothetical protein
MMLLVFVVGFGGTDVEVFSYFVEYLIDTLPGVLTSTETIVEFLVISSTTGITVSRKTTVFKYGKQK